MCFYYRNILDATVLPSSCNISTSSLNLCHICLSFLCQKTSINCWAWMKIVSCIDRPTWAIVRHVVFSNARYWNITASWKTAECYRIHVLRKQHKYLQGTFMSINSCNALAFSSVGVHATPLLQCLIYWITVRSVWKLTADRKCGHMTRSADILREFKSGMIKC